MIFSPVLMVVFSALSPAPHPFEKGTSVPVPAGDGGLRPVTL